MSAIRAARKTAENSVHITEQLPEQLSNVQMNLNIITACVVVVSSFAIVALSLYVGNQLHAKS